MLCAPRFDAYPVTWDETLGRLPRAVARGPDHRACRVNLEFAVALRATATQVLCHLAERDGSVVRNRQTEVLECRS